MEAIKTVSINGKKIEMFNWAGRHVTYIDNRKTPLSFQDAVDSVFDEVENRAKQNL